MVTHKAVPGTGVLLAHLQALLGGGFLFEMTLLLIIDTINIIYTNTAVAGAGAIIHYSYNNRYGFAVVVGGFDIFYLSSICIGTDERSECMRQ